MKNKKMFLNWFVLFFTIVSLTAGILFTDKSAEAGKCVSLCNQHFLGGCHGSQPNYAAAAVSTRGTCIVRLNNTPETDFNTIIADMSCDSDNNNQTCLPEFCPTSGFGLSASNSLCQVYYDLTGSNNAECKDSIIIKGDTWDNARHECIECSGNQGYVWGTSTGIAYTIPSLVFKEACGAVAACDGKTVGGACGAGSCDKNGACCLPPNILDAGNNCVVPAVDSMSLQITAGDNPLEINDTTTVTFRTKKTSDGTDINGATISITSISCGTLPNPASTTSSGKTTSTFSAPGIAGNCTIKAKATHASYDDATATYVISVQSADCINDYRIWFDDDDYIKGDTLQLWGKVFAAGDDSIMCLYREGTDKDDKLLAAGAFPSDINFLNVSAGTWQGGLFKDSSSCGAYNSADCKTEVIVVECKDDDDCSGTDVCNGDNECEAAGGGGGGGGFCPNSLSCTTPITAATVGCDCNGVVATAANVGDYCCLMDSTFYSTLAACNTSPCGGGGGGGGACDNDNIKEAGEQCDGTDLDGKDCTTFGYTGGTLSCTGSCTFDTSACTGGGGSGIPCGLGTGELCNPLTGWSTIPDIAEGMLNYLLGLVGSVALLFLIIAGVMYMTASGNEERITSAKKILTGALIGLAIVLLAYSLLVEIRNILGVI